MTTATQPPYLHDAHDALAAAPFHARHFYAGMSDPLYALASSGAFLLGYDIIAALEEAATIAETAEPEDDGLDDEDPTAIAEAFRISAAVLTYCLDRSDEEDPALRHEDVARELHTSYGIDAYADEVALYVPAP